MSINRYEVWIPKHVGPTWALSNLLPRRARDVRREHRQVIGA
jgi:hypothetical protein